jgi:transposase InsO family protein
MADDRDTSLHATDSVAEEDGVHHWVIDSGASSHFCNDLSLFSTFTASTTRRVQVAAGDERKAAGVGTVTLDVVLPDGSHRRGVVNGVLFMPDMRANLLSMARLTDQGLRFDISSTAITIHGSGGMVYGVAQRVGEGLWRLPARKAAANAFLSTSARPVDWHARFGHADPRAITCLFQQQLAAASDADCAKALADLKAAAVRTEHCAPCLSGKQHRAPLTGSVTGMRRATRLLELIHVDLCGPFPTKARDGGEYLFVIVDDYSRYTWIHVLLSKSGPVVLDAFKYYHRHAEAQHSAAGHRVRAIRSDNGGEFINGALSLYLDQHGIQPQLTAAYTPQHNSVVERKNQTLIGDVRTFMHASGLQIDYPDLWAEAALTSAYLRNRLPTTSVSGVTPVELWRGAKPSVDHLRPFGCVAYVHVPKVRRTKLDARSHRCYLLGYSTNSQQYRLFDDVANAVIQSRDVVFDEHVLYKDIVAVGEPTTDIESAGDSDDVPPPAVPAALPQQSVPAAAPVSMPSAVPQQSLPVPVSNPRSLRSSGPAPPIIVPRSMQGKHNISSLIDTKTTSGWHSRTGRLDVPSAVVFEQANSEEPDQASLAILAEFGHDEDIAELAGVLLVCTAAADKPITRDPLTYEEAMASPNAAEWTEAIEAEMDAHREAHSYDLVNCPPDQTPIGFKWVFTTKFDAAGNVIKRKARLTAQGCSQRYGIDYEETYAPVCRIGSIRVLTALAAHYDWEIHHMDVNSAFLNGELKERVYMRQPTGFRATGAQANHVWKLNKSIYGLKQAGRTWHEKIDTTLQASGFSAIDADACVYRQEKGFSVIIISLYVDDLVLFSNDLKSLTSFKAALSTRFKMKDLGEAKFVLGIEIIRDRSKRTIALSQASYTRQLLRTYDMEACNPTDTPVQSSVRLAPPAETFKATVRDIRRYQAAVGALMFASICTRPDITYAVGQLSQYASNPDKSHFHALTQVFRYLRGTVEYRLSYKGAGRAEDVPSLVGYSDADWAGDVGQRRSTTGYAFLLCGGAVSWQSKRQRTIAQSTVEAEYMAAASATKEAIWLRSLLTGIGCAPGHPTVLRVDNEGAIKLAENPRHHDLTKHIAVRYHLIRHHIAEGTITLTHISTQLQTADCLTKGLLREKHGEALRLLGME